MASALMRFSCVVLLCYKRSPPASAGGFLLCNSFAPVPAGAGYFFLCYTRPPSALAGGFFICSVLLESQVIRCICSQSLLVFPYSGILSRFRNSHRHFALCQFVAQGLLVFFVLFSLVLSGFRAVSFFSPHSNYMDFWYFLQSCVTQYEIFVLAFCTEL